MTANTLVFDESSEHLDDSRLKPVVMRWVLVGVAALLAAVVASVLTVFLFLNRQDSTPPRSIPVAEPQATSQLPVAEASKPEQTPTVEAPKPELATVAEVPKTEPLPAVEPSRPEPVMVPKKSREEQEREALLAKLKATRENAKGEESKAALAGVEYGEAVKDLIEVCKGEALSDFSSQVSVACGCNVGDRILMIGRRLAGMKNDDDKIGSASCDLVLEIQKVAEMLKDKPDLSLPKRKLMVIAGLDPASAEAFRACTALIEAMDRRKVR